MRSLSSQPLGFYPSVNASDFNTFGRFPSSGNMSFCHSWHPISYYLLKAVL